MFKVSDLRHKDIINIVNGKRMGIVRDIDVDMDEGKINALILPGSARFINVFFKAEDTVIPWNRIKKIGADVVLVEYDESVDFSLNQREYFNKRADTERKEWVDI